MTESVFGGEKIFLIGFDVKRRKPSFEEEQLLCFLVDDLNFNDQILCFKWLKYILESSEHRQSLFFLRYTSLFGVYGWYSS